MGDTAETVTETDETAATGTGRKRERSQIEFPYSDLERSVDLATVLLREGGQAKIEQTQLAVAMDQSANGGTFRGRVGAARMFGLIETEQGKVGLTPLGLRATDEQSAPAAKAEAFLNIPLYKAMFDRYQEPLSARWNPWASPQNKKSGRARPFLPQRNMRATSRQMAGSASQRSLPM